MISQARKQTKASAAPSSGFLQRKCSDCRKERQLLQRRTVRPAEPEAVPSIVHEVLRSPGQPLDRETRVFMEPRFGRDFSRVRVHTDEENVKQVPDSSVVAYSVGRDMMLGAGENGPETERGRSYPRENKPLEEGNDLSDRRAGLSEPNINYGGVTTRKNSVFYVNFHHARPPEVPDHSQRRPGPNGARANRAGYTRVHLSKRMNIPWDKGPAQSGGRIPLFAQSVNVFYRIDPIEVFVSRDYAASSCPYRVTLEHERSHVRDFLGIFRDSYEPLIPELGRVDVPGRNSPRMVEPANVEAMQDAIGQQLRQVILSHSSSLVARMEADRRAKDAPSAYAAAYARCPASEWQMGQEIIGSEHRGVGR